MASLATFRDLGITLAEVMAWTDKQLERAIELLGDVHRRQARDEADAFIEYAIPHELTAQPVKNGRHHQEWHRFLDENPWSVIFAPVEHGKTQQIAVGRVVHALGRNPNLRIGLYGNSITKATQTLGAIAGHIARNPRVKEVFPDLRPSSDPRAKWTATEITVERTTYAKDASVTALGIYAPPGARFDIIVLDDVLDFENTRTPEQMEKLLAWFESTVLTRLTPGGQLWIIGTPWNPDDLMHVLAGRPDFASARWSAVENPADPPAQWRPLWPQQFPADRLAKIQANTTPHNFGRKYLCQVRDDERSRFRQEWLDQCHLLGRGLTMLDRAPVTPAGKLVPCFTGVDLGVGEKQEDALTVLFTIALLPDGKRRVCEIQSGRWQAPEIVQRIYDVHRRFDSLIVVESNGAQRFLVQFAAHGGLPVRPFHTGARNKHDEQFGVESLAIELQNARWVIPSGPTAQTIHPEVKAWEREMLYYTPTAHTGDRMMAGWFAREAARNYAAPMYTHMDTMTR